MIIVKMKEEFVFLFACHPEGSAFNKYYPRLGAGLSSQKLVAPDLIKIDKEKKSIVDMRQLTQGP